VCRIGGGTTQDLGRFLKMGTPHYTMGARIRGAILGRLGAELRACENDTNGEALPARLADLMERLRRRDFVQDHGPRPRTSDQLSVC
jgi:hypothetical protein